MIVNFIRGERGNGNAGDRARRHADKVHLIQALGGDDDPDLYGPRFGGRVTDTWDWQAMPNPAVYHIRRAKP